MIMIPSSCALVEMPQAIQSMAIAMLEITGGYGAVSEVIVVDHGQVYRMSVTERSADLTMHVECLLRGIKKTHTFWLKEGMVVDKNYRG